MTLRPIVIDMNHADASEEVNGKLIDRVDFKKAYKWGARGVMHKATEGGSFVDPLYASRRTKALAAGLLWGAYHFARPGDIGGQVSFFLGAVGKGQGTGFTRYALDYEDPKLGLWQAEHFLEVLYNATRQRAWLYSGFLVREQTARSDPGRVLSQYPLWLAEYSEVAKVPRPWQNYVLWQRSGDGEGPAPHDVPGIGVKQDINYFDGTDDELRAVWLDMG
jgi:lysozyme